MSGLYVHIPFCVRKCGYCDFYSVKLGKDTHLLSLFTEKIINEILLKSYLFDKETVETVYFGGGTPSILPVKTLETIFSAIAKNFSLAKTIECTLEINPEHATDEYFSDLQRLGFVNRLSTGFQAMTDDGLKYLGRRHTVDDNLRYLQLCQKYGFSNYSVDYIFGYEILTADEIERAFQFLIGEGVPHISAYSLGIEENTPFMLKFRKGLIHKMDDDFYLSQFLQIHNLLESNGYNHYEISNYSLPGCHSRHNSNYWESVPYLGFGPSAHSYYDGTRSWNARKLSDYQQQIANRKLYAEHEILTEDDIFNEYIMLRLRTRQGIDIEYLTLHFAKYVSHFQKILRRKEMLGFFNVNDRYVNLNLNGIFISDHIISEFFV
jgi:oxygen-independent coproporphyrinogen-3 oxidase